jgi:hypothetical protein
MILPTHLQMAMVVDLIVKRVLCRPCSPNARTGKSCQVPRRVAQLRGGRRVWRLLAWLGRAGKTKKTVRDKLRQRGSGDKNRSQGGETLTRAWRGEWRGEWMDWMEWMEGRSNGWMMAEMARGAVNRANGRCLW